MPTKISPFRQAVAAVDRLVWWAQKPVCLRQIEAGLAAERISKRHVHPALWELLFSGRVEYLTKEDKYKISDNVQPLVTDCKGYPIFPGDLVRVKHFRDRTKRGKYKFLYFLVFKQEGYLRLVPVCELFEIFSSEALPQLPQLSGTFLSTSLAESTEILKGQGPLGLLTWDDRPRKKKEPAESLGVSEGLE